MQIRILPILFLLLACSTPKIPFCPKVTFTPPCECLPKTGSAFPPLTPEELKEDYAKELKIGLIFAKNCDFYRAITAFKRALILINPSHLNRRDEIEYNIILAYYMSGKYEEALASFDTSCLKCHLSPNFAAFHDLLIILYDAALKCGNCEYAKKVYIRLQARFPSSAQILLLSEQITQGHLKEAASSCKAPPYLSPLYCGYLRESKSVKTAEILNAMLPGAGYWYVGQKNTAITALIVNGLFAYAAYQFFDRGYVAAGIITSSLELGWYFGGIYGGGRAASQYNEYKYEEYGKKALDESHLYPILQLHFIF